MSPPLLHPQLLPPLRVAILGFSDFERSALATYFRLAGAGNPRYVQVVMLTRADFVVADADHLPSVQLVVATERLADAVFIGKQPPPDAVAWMTRPIDPLHVTRELDAMAAARGLLARDAAVPLPKPAAAATVVERVAASGALHVAVEAAQAPDPPALRDIVLAPPAQAAAAGPRALIVDDSAIAQRFLQARLEPWGLVADRASSSGQAIALMRQHSYDLVFVDVELGAGSDLDGLALCQHIKRSASAMNALVVIVSAHHSEMDRVRGALAGCDGYLAKPLGPTELQRLLLRQGLKAPEPESSV